MYDKQQLENALFELKQLLQLKNNTRKDILELALKLLLSLSSDDNFLELLSVPEAVDGLCKQLSELYFSSHFSNHLLLVTIFVNLTSNQQSMAITYNFLDDAPLINACLDKCLNYSSDSKDISTVRSVQFLSNLSRINPSRFAEQLNSIPSCQDYLNKIIDFFTKTEECTRTTAKQNISIVKYLGYLLINLSTVRLIAIQLARDKLDFFIAMLSPNVNQEKRLATLEIIYNLSIQDELHELLLRDEPTMDALLCALLGPLADAEDQLDEEEIAKLPLGLQYWEAQRENDPLFRQKAVHTLYQLCATRIGRQVLRRKGIYALLRELDKSRGGKEHQKEGMMIFLGNEQTKEGEETSDMLRALIGILIRLEEDMGLSNEELSASIRNLGVE